MHKFTPNEYQQLVVFYNRYFRSLVDSRLTTWESVTTVLQKMLTELEPEEKKQLLAIYNNTEDKSSIKTTLTLNELDEIFREYLKEQIAMPLRKPDAAVKTENTISGGIEIDLEQIYAMTCKEREEYIMRGRIEGADFLDKAQEIQEAVNSKLANINLDKDYVGLENKYISTAVVLSQLKGDPSSHLRLDYSIAIELENRLRKATLARLSVKISELIAHQNIDVVKIFIQQQSEHALELAIHREAVQDFLETLDDYSDNLCDFMSILNLTDKTLNAIKNQPISIMISGFFRICSNAERLLTITDPEQSNMYLNSVAQRLVCEIDSFVKSKSVADVPSAEFNYPVWTEKNQDLESVERVGILLAGKINQDAGKGVIKPNEYANYITWLSLCLPSMHGDNLDLYFKALYKLQEGFIKTLTRQQAAIYQDNFAIAYIGDASKSRDSDNNVQTQKYVEKVLFCIDRRIAELENKPKLGKT